VFLSKCGGVFAEVHFLNFFKDKSLSCVFSEKNMKRWQLLFLRNAIAHLTRKVLENMVKNADLLFKVFLVQNAKTRHVALSGFDFGLVDVVI